MQKWPGQVVLCVSQIHWTHNVHKALNNEDNMSIPTFFESLRNSLNDIVALIREPTLTNLARITVKVGFSCCTCGNTHHLINWFNRL